MTEGEGPQCTDLAGQCTGHWALPGSWHTSQQAVCAFSQLVHAARACSTLTGSAVNRQWKAEVDEVGEAEDTAMVDAELAAGGPVKQEPAERPVTRERAVGSGGCQDFGEWKGLGAGF